MKLYFTIGVLAAILMFTALGGYRLIFEPEEESSLSASNNTSEKYDSDAAFGQKRRFIALVCDHFTEGEPYVVKVAFCSVILNRCYSGYFPSAPSDVIFSDPIFKSCYDMDFTSEPSHASLNAFDDALNGFSPCADALYYIKSYENNSILMRRRVKFKCGENYFL